MVICCCLPVPRSFAETFTMPLASMSNVTSIWGTPRRAAGDAGELEAAEGLVVVGHLALALQNVNLNGGLVVGRRGVHLGLAGRDGGVTLDHLGHNTAHGLNAQGKRGDVQKKDALNVAGQNTALNSCADSNEPRPG